MALFVPRLSRGSLSSLRGFGIRHSPGWRRFCVKWAFSKGDAYQALGLLQIARAAVFGVQHAVVARLVPAQCASGTRTGLSAVPHGSHQPVRKVHSTVPRCRRSTRGKNFYRRVMAWHALDGLGCLILMLFEAMSALLVSVDEIGLAGLLVQYHFCLVLPANCSLARSNLLHSLRDLAADIVAVRISQFSTVP